MDYEQLFGGARWELLKALSHGKASATELSKATKLSLPNISQQLKLLEAYEFVEHVKDRKGPGKPRQVYTLKRELCHLTFARSGYAEKRFFNPGPYHTMLLNILFLPNIQDHPYLHAYLLNDELTANCAVAFLKSGEHDLEVLLLTDNLELIRAKYSGTYISYAGKSRKVVAWTHNLQELNDGLARKEPYFENLLKNPIILHDPKRQFEKIKRK
jgi:hypothetical protein